MQNISLNLKITTNWSLISLDTNYMFMKYSIKEITKTFLFFIITVSSDGEGYSYYL